MNRRNRLVYVMNRRNRLTPSAVTSTYDFSSFILLYIISQKKKKLVVE